jgi:hypothetical protein
MSSTTTQLLSSGEFWKLRYDTIPVKSASAKFFSIPVTQKCQILSCDTLVANKRYVRNSKLPRVQAQRINLSHEKQSVSFKLCPLHHGGTSQQ